MSSLVNANAVPAILVCRHQGDNTGTLLIYWNNSVPASEPWLAENGQSTLRQARLNGPGSQHTLSHDAVSSPTGHFQGISEPLRPVFPVIQQRPLFLPLIVRGLAGTGSRRGPGRPAGRRLLGSPAASPRFAQASTNCPSRSHTPPLLPAGQTTGPAG